MATKLAVDQAEADHLVHDPVVERHIGAGSDKKMLACSATVPARVDVDDLGAAPRLLEERRRHLGVGGRVAAGDDRDVGVLDVAVGGRDRARADTLEQRRDTGRHSRVQLVDVVGAEAGADQLLEEVGLLVGALRRPGKPAIPSEPLSAISPSRRATRSSASSQLASRKCGITSS